MTFLQVMNKNARHKDIIDQTIINIKEKHPDMGAFLGLDYNTKFDIIHTIIENHEESMIDVSEEGIPIQLPFIGRLLIKEGKILYNDIVEEYLQDNNLSSKRELTDDDKLNIINLLKSKKLSLNLDKPSKMVETKVLTFKLKC